MGKGEKGAMTVSEAGRKGGETTSEKYGHEFYEEIGHKGGQKVKRLIEEGKKALRTGTGKKPGR
ncbi:MAG: Em GEA1 (EM1) [Armatimonadetes bacterium]|nr:Em GEA1 (EM1) [Armatimonadota bacterium]